MPSKDSMIVQDTLTASTGIWIVVPSRLPDETFDEMFSRLVTAASAVDGRKATVVSTARPALAAGQTDPVILPHLAPAAVVAAALTSGQNPAEALAAWCVDTTALLDVVRQQRRRFTPVDLERAARDPVAFCQAMNRRFGLDLPADGPIPVTGPVSGADALLHVLARAIADHDPQTQTLLAELEPAMLTLYPSSGVSADLGADRTRALSAWRDLIADQALAVALQQKLDTMGEAEATLRTQIHHQQLEIERHYLAGRDAEAQSLAALQDTEARTSNLQDRLIQQTAELARIQTAALATQEEAAALQDSLSGQTAELASVRAAAEAAHDQTAAAQCQALATAEQKLAARDSEIADLKTRIEDIYASRSWRITAPMRLLRRGLIPPGGPKNG